MKKILLALALFAATGPTQAPAQPATSTAVQPTATPPTSAPSTAPPAADPQQLSQTVTDKHPYAVYFILIAASLAAVASLASSSLTAWVTWKSKDKEYKNDYYKKVIDKRLKAIEKAEVVLALFNNYSSAGSTGAWCHSYFKYEMGTEGLSDAIKDTNPYSIWYGPNTENALDDFTQTTVVAVQEAHRINNSTEDGYFEYCVSVYQKIEQQKQILEISIADDMRRLYDVDAFLKERRKTMLKVKNRNTHLNA